MRRLLICGICALVGIPQVSAQAPAASRPMSAAGTTTPPRILPGTPATAFGTIVGSALDAANGPLPESLVRVRDVKVGRIVTSQWTDKMGRFDFGGVDPGSYVVELVNRRDEAVLATSQMAVVNGGETVSVIVRLPSRVSPAAALFGTNTRAVAITAAAAAAGVLTVAVGRTVISPE